MNVLIHPSSGFIEFNTGLAGPANFDGTLLGSTRMTYRSGELNVMSDNTGTIHRFTIDGANGRLLQVSDVLTGTLFNVNTMAGLPVFEVYSNGILVMGQFNRNDLVVSGNQVGIGTIPTSKLTVSGNFGQSPMRVQASGNIEALFITTGGRVGINHLNPQYTLDVSGSGNFLNGLYVSGIPVVTGVQSFFVNTGQTGVFVPRGETGIFVARGETGNAFYPRFGNPSNFLTSAQGGGVSALVVTGTSLSGTITISGTANISVLTGYAGQNIIAISGWDTGQYITTAMTGQFAPAGMTGQFITTAQTGNFVSNGMTGTLVPAGLTGNAFYPRFGNPSNFLTSASASAGVTGISVTGQVLTGLVFFSGYSGVTVNISGDTVRIACPINQTGNNMFYANSALKFGLGIQLPKYPFHLVGSDAYFNSDVIVAPSKRLSFNIDSDNRFVSNGEGGVIFFDGAGRFLFYTTTEGTAGADASVQLSNPPKMMIDNNGLVGINRTPTSYQLEVGGSGNFTIGAYVSGVPVLTGAATLLSVTGQNITGFIPITGISGIRVYMSGSQLVISGGFGGAAAAGVNSIIYSGGSAAQGDIRLTGQHGISITGGSPNTLFINPIRGTYNLPTGNMVGFWDPPNNTCPLVHCIINWNSGEMFQYVFQGSGYGPVPEAAPKIIFIHSGITPGKTLRCSFVNTGVTFPYSNGAPSFSGEAGFYSGVVWDGLAGGPSWQGIYSSTTSESHADCIDFWCIGKTVYGKTMIQDAYMAGVILL